MSEHNNTIQRGSSDVLSYTYIYVYHILYLILISRGLIFFSQRDDETIVKGQAPMSGWSPTPSRK